MCIDTILFLWKKLVFVFGLITVASLCTEIEWVRDRKTGKSVTMMITSFIYVHVARVLFLLFSVLCSKAIFILSGSRTYSFTQTSVNHRRPIRVSISTICTKLTMDDEQTNDRNERTNETNERTNEQIKTVQRTYFNELIFQTILY